MLYSLSRCAKSYHYPCIPIASKCRNTDDEDMYLSFCSRRCEENFFVAKPKVVPLEGRTQFRKENVEVMEKPKSRKKSGEKKEAQVKVEQSEADADMTMDMSADTTMDMSADTTTDATSDSTSDSTFYSANASNNQGETDAANAEESVEGGSREASAAAEERPDVAIKQPAVTERLIKLLADRQSSAAAQPPVATPQPLAPAAPQQPAAPQPIADPQPIAAPEPSAAPQPLGAPQRVLHAPLTPPYEEPMDEDGGAAEARAVCVRIRDKSFKVQAIGGFVFPHEVMDGAPKTDANFFPPQRESSDLFKVVGELSRDRYRLVESSSHFPGATGNLVFDGLLRDLRLRQVAGFAELDIDNVVDLHVIHPRPQREYFRFVLEESFTRLCENLNAKIRANPGPSDVPPAANQGPPSEVPSAIMLFPLFIDGRALIQPLYNGIIIPKALSYGLVVNCLNGARREECGNARLQDWRVYKWPSCMLVQVLPKSP